MIYLKALIDSIYVQWVAFFGGSIKDRECLLLWTILLRYSCGATFENVVFRMIIKRDYAFKVVLAPKEQCLFYDDNKDD